MTAKEPRPGTDTATGTDPDAKWDKPGYEDKSLGQAVQQDEELAEALDADQNLDDAEAEERFEEESAGAPARERQNNDG